MVHDSKSEYILDNYSELKEDTNVSKDKTSIVQGETIENKIEEQNFINKNLLEFLPTISKYKIYGTDVVNGVELDNIIADKNIAIVLGNEGNGISKEVKNLIKENIYIPMLNTESLNVSVAGSIIMYKLRG